MSVLIAHTVQAAPQYHLVYGSFGDRTVATEEARRYTSRFDDDFDVLRSLLANGEVTWRVTRGPYVEYGKAETERDTIDAEAWILASESGTSQNPIVEVSSVAAPEAVVGDRTDAPSTDVSQADVLPTDALPTGSRIRRSAPADVNRGVRVVSADQFSRPLPREVPPATEVFSDVPPVGAGTVNTQIQLKQINVRGQNILAAELEPLFATYIDEPVQATDLVDLTNAANQIYLTNGYINSGLILRNQPLSEGVLYLDEVLGRISDVAVSGRLRSRYVRNRLTTGTPFNLNALQTSLSLLEQDPRIDNVNAHIRPGATLGTATLDLKVNAPDFHKVGIFIDNNRSPSVGAEQATIYVQSINLSGIGDSLFVSGSASEGLDSYALSYELPIGSQGHSLTFGASSSEGTVIEEPFDVVDIDSETESLRLGLNWMLLRRLDRSLVLEVLYEQRRNFTSVLGVPFSFSDGAIDGESRVAPVRIALQYVQQGDLASLSGRLVVSVGTEGYSATMNDSRPDGDYTSVLAQFQYSRRISERFVMTGKLLTQQALDPLLAIERVDLGGMDSVRGYRKNQLVRDNALLLSLEGRYRLSSTPLIDALAILDIAEGQNHDDASSTGKDSLASIGAGLRLRWQGLRADLMLAHGLEDVPSPQNPDLQDDGVHFRVAWEHSF
ncbi:MAG: ShlB/FhaC/HecB family hemolysin secretion/activation protein [Pseudomonadota bacterium]